eukprot:gb/GFBE01038360.1/.p1 GENE.gb/GFBE01038360.1/~~gb/GFBE01038360.1/.p1  ORF type:complete len:161 (+),score=25.59 gb/GFBE01038360.1/:1-483(+)
MGRSRSRSRSRSGGGADLDRIQDLVDERQQARRDRDFDKADRMRDELKDMGVRIDDTELSWNGPGGSSGVVNNPGGKPPGSRNERRDGDWDCPECGKLVFASKDNCFSCGASKRSSRRDSRDRRRRGGSRYDDDDRHDRRGGGRRGRDDYSDDDRDRRRR